MRNSLWGDSKNEFTRHYAVQAREHVLRFLSTRASHTLSCVGVVVRGGDSFFFKETHQKSSSCKICSMQAKKSNVRLFSLGTRSCSHSGLSPSWGGLTCPLEMVPFVNNANEGWFPTTTKMCLWLSFEVNDTTHQKNRCDAIAKILKNAPQIFWSNNWSILGV